MTSATYRYAMFVCGGTTLLLLASVNPEVNAPAWSIFGIAYTQDSLKKDIKLTYHDGPRRKLTSLVFLFALLLFLHKMHFANWELRLNGTNALIPAG